MTLNEIAWFLIRKYNLIEKYGNREGRARAFKIAAKLIKEGAYDQTPATVKAQAENEYSNATVTSEPDTDNYTPDFEIPDTPPIDDGVHDNETAKKWIDALYEKMRDAYSGASDFFQDAQALLKEVIDRARQLYEGDELTLKEKMEKAGIPDIIESMLPYPEGNRDDFESEYRLANGKISLTWLTMVDAILNELNIPKSRIYSYSIMKEHFI